MRKPLREKEQIIEPKRVFPNTFKEFKDLIRKINKKFEGAIFTLAGETSETSQEFFPTGFLNLDFILGGGIPLGKIIEVFGWEGVGKSTFGLQLSKKIVEKGKAIVWIDFEHSFNLEFAKNLGIDLNYLVISQPASGEEGLEIIRTVLKESKGSIGLVVIDSLAALSSIGEMESSLEDNLIGRSASLISRGLKGLIHLAETNKAIILTINQLRETIGRGIIMKKTPGGYLLKFLASQRIEIQMTEKQEDGFMAKFKVIKNKFNIPYKEVKMKFLWDKGFSTEFSLYEVLKERKLFSGDFNFFLKELQKVGERHFLSIL